MPAATSYTIASKKATSFFIRKSKPVHSIAYDTYWKFAAERQNIFFNRLQGSPYPWTKDTILQKHKFTNAYRVSDRVSQYLVKNVIEEGSQEPNDLFFRIILFKIFNKIETWEFLRNKIGKISLETYSFKTYDKLLSELLKNKIAIYSAAYIMASGGSAYKYKRKHQNHLKLIEQMLMEHVPAKLQAMKNMKDGFELLKTYPAIGDFLAYQYITDINYSSLTSFSEMEFVKAGPGAKDGIRKCFSDLGGYSEEDIIKMMCDNQQKEFDRLGLSFQSLWGRELQLIDCQNIFCEVDKYSRVAHPEITGVSGRTRIKQKFTPTSLVPIQYTFPKKWKLKFNQ